MITTMRLDPVNAVSSFHYYMWNAWSEEECKITFGGAYKHFWEKWNSLASKSILGAAERFYAELSDNNRELLVNRAVALYDGKATREEPHDEDVYVCDACGSRKIEIQVWVNANTNEYLSDVDDDDTDCKWCADCEQSQNFCTLSDYKQRMQDWWKDLDFITMESITGLREADHSAEDGSQSFVDACNDWWNGQGLRYPTRTLFQITILTLTTMTDNEIIERICGSCNCDEATAKEYLNDEIRHLRELQEVNDLQESDIELSCSGLGIESECMEYFTMVLTY